MKFGKEEAIAFRKELKLSVEELAKFFKITPDELRGYENGKAIPPLVLKKYQMFKHTGEETSDDFKDIGDFG